MISGCLYLCNMWSVLPYLSSLSLPSVLSVHIFSIWPCPDCFVYYCYHPVISAMLCIRMALAALEMTKKSPEAHHTCLSTSQQPIYFYSLEHQSLSLTSYFKHGTSPLLPPVITSSGRQQPPVPQDLPIRWKSPPSPLSPSRWHLGFFGTCQDLQTDDGPFKLI